MIKCVGALINPFKDEYELKYQIFPTINLGCKQTLHSWFQLRCCIMDFGKKYMLRIFFYSSVFLGLYFTFAVIMLLSFFSLITLEVTPVWSLICVFDIFIVLGVLLSMFYYGAVINDQYESNKLQLIKIKQMLIYVRANLSLIMSPAKFSSAYMKVFQRIFKKMYKN